MHRQGIDVARDDLDVVLGADGAHGSFNFSVMFHMRSRENGPKTWLWKISVELLPIGTTAVTKG